MMGNVLFFVIELQLQYTDECMAQLFLELLSGFISCHCGGGYSVELNALGIAAANRNSTLNHEKRRVYGLLTDLNSFKFYSFDPSVQAFFKDETITVNNKRDTFTTDMIEGLFRDCFRKSIDG